MFLKSLESACHIKRTQEEYVLLLYYIILFVPQIQEFLMYEFNNHRSKILKTNFSVLNMYRTFGPLFPKQYTIETVCIALTLYYVVSIIQR